MKAYYKISVFILILLPAGCEIIGEIPELSFFLNKEWRLESVSVNGSDVVDVDISGYRIRLNKDFTFNETGIEGAENSGIWQLDNNATILAMEYENGVEIKYLIIDLQIRQLVLRVIQSEEKIGSLDILYNLVPVKI
ncbi:MAG: hypothetical protein IH947_15920 [Bacteroidetes bacterium]|nr:hypothetical protein [Bacteroidota bacterium]MCH8232645.1 hypothetical protein [Bacteroidota bacterium]